MTKRCSRCQLVKDSSEFYKNKRTATGLTSYCKDCNKVKALEWKRNHPEAMARWRADMLERNPEHERQYRAINKDRDSARIARWSKENRARRNATQNARRAREYSGGTYSAEEWLDLCDQYGNVCLSCGIDEITVDHVVPLVRGGANTIDNLQPLCKKCNFSKGSKIIDYRKEKVS